MKRLPIVVCTLLSLGLWAAPAGAQTVPSCPCSLWSDSALPAVVDAGADSPVELGVKVIPQVDGRFVALRFYKSAANAGPHIGDIWLPTGELLGSVMFQNETASGWQQMTLPAPIPVTAGTTYIVSYHSPTGHYAYTSDYFVSQYLNGPLQSPSASVAPNGVYQYGSAGSIPTNANGATNYWVDAVFEPAPENLPAVTQTSPAAGATDATPPVVATFGTDMLASSIVMKLRDPGGAVVPASLTYVPSTRSAVLTPGAALGSLTTYSAVVEAGTDTQGRSLPGPYSWTFTTGTSGFRESIVLAGLQLPMSIQFAPSGAIFVAEKSGIIKVFEGLDDQTPTIFADLRTEVFNAGDRGMMGIALHPDFPNQPYLYVAYDRDAAIGGVAPRWGTPGASSDPCPNPPGWDEGCVISGRVSRLRATPVAGGFVMTGPEEVLIDDWGQQGPSHSLGTIKFGPDGALYVSGGDGAFYNMVDYGQRGNPPNPLGDPPVPIGGAMTPPGAEGGALRSQSLRRANGGPVLLNGTVIRVDPLTGAGLPGNPLAGSTDANARRIIAQGLRNPFRFTFRPGTSEIWLGDVGWNDWEELDRLPGVPATVANFGWPCYEGFGRQGGYESADLALCASLYAEFGAVTAPHFAYAHSAQIVPGEPCGVGGSSITGVAFYQGGTYPAAYSGALFFADYSRNCIWVMFPDDQGVPDPSRVATFKPSASAPVELKIGPGGDLFYVDILGAIRRIQYVAFASDIPQARLTATPAAGTAPLIVDLDGTASTGGGADGLTYSWDFGDGAVLAPGASRVTHTYGAGTFVARLTVRDTAGQSSVATAAVNVNNTPPVAVIQTPVVGRTWQVGEVIAFSGSATDAEEGTLSASQLSWSLVLYHCAEGQACHMHPIQDYAGVSGGAFTAPDHEYPSYLLLTLTARDATGLTSTASVRLDPRTLILSFDSVPTGMTLAVGSTVSTTPFVRTVAAGSSQSISAPTPQPHGSTTYAFSGWSDGGAQTHQIVASASATFVASYVSQTPSSYSLFTPADLPGDTDAGPDSPVELGMKFKADASGAVLGVRFYKGAANGGTHVGSLWTTSGTRLAFVTFTNETASGWQEARFSAPVTIAAGTTYIVSYHSTSGHYAFSPAYFATPRDRSPLHAPGAAEPNGVFTYGDPGTFPAASFNATNYWVDVVFQLLNGPNRPPVLLNPGNQVNGDTWGYAPAVLADAPAAYWRLGETTGTTAADGAGSNAGTLFGGVTLGQGGALADTNPAMAFNGSTGYVRVPNPAVSLAGDLTIELWLNVSLAARQTLISKDYLHEFELTLESSGKLSFYQGNGTAYQGILSTPGAVAANTWQHLVVTRTAATNTIRFYVNGVAKGSGTYVTPPASSTRPISIGRSDGGTQYVNGRLDDVALYPAALSAAQIAAHYALRASADGPAAVALQLVASDPDGDIVTYSATGLPPGVTVNAATGLISGTLSAATAGTHQVTATASDGYLSNSQTFTWTVTHANRAPTLTNPGSQTSAENASVSLALSASDADGDALTYSVTGLPAALTLDAASGVISGTLSFASAGTYAVTATVSDGSLASSSQTFTWTVANTNRPPVLANPGSQTSWDISSYAQGALAGAPVAYWRFGETSGTSAADAAGSHTGTLFGGITLGQSGALADGNPAMLFNGSTGYVRVVNPAVSLAGDLTIELWVNVSLATRQTLISKDYLHEFELTLESSGRLTFYQGNGTTYQGTLSTPGAVTANAWHHVVVTRTVAPNMVRFYVNGIEKGGGAFATPPATSTKAISIGRSDGGTQYVNGRLDEVALYPAALSAAQIAAHYALRTSAGTSTSIALPLVASDVDGDALTYSATGLPSGLTVNAATGLISGTLSAASAGIHQVTATASDGSLAQSQTFAWTVTHVNRAPALTGPGNQTNAENTTVSLPLTASDPDGDSITYSAIGLPAALTINPGTGVISGTLSLGTTGVYVVTATATDGQVANSQTFTWTITHANRAPTLSGVGNQTSAESASVSLALAASDPDGDSLSYSATGLPAGLAINAATGLISGTLSFTSAGVYAVTATVSDGSLSNSQPFTWTVANTNRAPVVANPGPQTHWDISGYAPAVLADAPAAYWRLSETTGTSAADAAGSNAGTVFGGVTLNQSGALADGNPAMSFNGSTGYVRVANSAAVQLAGDLTIELWVNASLATRQTLISKDYLHELELTLEMSGKLTFYQGNGTAYQGIPSAVGAVAPNTWQHVVVTRTTATKTIRFYVNGVAKGSGTYTTAPTTSTKAISIGRSDGGIQYVSGRLDDIALYPAALSAAQIAAHYAQRTSAGTATIVQLQLTAGDPDGEALTYSASGLPLPLTINTTTGLISGTLSAASAGTYQVTITASDGSLSQSQTFTWTVTHVN